MLAAWIVERDHSASRWPRAVTFALILEGAILAVLALGWHLAGTAVHRLEVSGITTTYITGITGTLTNLVARLMGRERRKARPVFRRSALLAAVWTVYLGGAAIGAVALSHAALQALVFPAALIIVVAVIAAVAFRQDRRA